MRLRILSDLHLRHHAPPQLKNPDDPSSRSADVVVLAGDIDRGIEGVAWARQAFPRTPVIYVAGNHEYYDRHLDTTRSTLRRASDPLRPPDDREEQRGVYVLERNALVIGSIRFLGCTLWTGFELFEGRRLEAMRTCREAVDDYRRIHLLRARRPLQPRDTDRFHRASIRWLRRQFRTRADPDIDATVVVTHHPPCHRSIDPRYVSRTTSAAFVARRGSLVKRSGARLWIHGHVHASFDYSVGDTRVVSNPRGHPGENPNFRSDATVEL